MACLVGSFRLAPVSRPRERSHDTPFIHTLGSNYTAAYPVFIYHMHMYMYACDHKLATNHHPTRSPPVSLIFHHARINHFANQFGLYDQYYTGLVEWNLNARFGHDRRRRQQLRPPHNTEITTRTAPARSAHIFSITCCHSIGRDAIS